MTKIFQRTSNLYAARTLGRLLIAAELKKNSLLTVSRFFSLQITKWAQECPPVGVDRNLAQRLLLKVARLHVQLATLRIGEIELSLDSTCSNGKSFLRIILLTSPLLAEIFLTVRTCK